ncbi:uncharacterized protein IUM83_14671 [Phytophthora cinnamomi]|uniref:uncharacterized protein n=1 Tax=Phytophthora cinnamomi TaxID=4785 RepID=UPI00355A6D67|nr:hypothetical protein IUM83_14671 [Phytophthora cinnamomi]
MRGSPAVLTVVGFIALWWCGEGVETAFDLRFEYEDPTSLLAGQTSVGGPRLRWNTQSVIAGFGMERGARVELQVADLQAAGAGNITEVPVVFTLYDIDQWRAYAVLKLREVHIQSNYVLCHYPAALRFAVPPPDPLAVLPWTVSFDVRKPSLYTLQAQVCGDASVNVTGRVSMVNLGYDGKLSEHLGVQELGLRPLYKVLFVVYLTAMVLWILECYVWRRTIPLKLTANYERWNCFVTPLTYMKLAQFQRFRFVFLGYLLMPTCLLLLNLLVVTPPGYWRYAWVNTLLTEVTTLVIVINIGLVVRPVDTYVYTRIARSTAPDIPNRDTTDPIEPPSLEPRQEDPVRPEATSTNNGSAAATPIDYPSVNTL